MAIGSRGKKSKSKRICCWRLDVESIGCFRPDYWYEKRVALSNFILSCILTFGSSIIGCGLFMLFMGFASPSATPAAALVGVILGGVIGSIISMTVIYKNDDSDHLRMDNGPWWSRGNQDEYREFMTWKRNHNKRKKKRKESNNV